MPRIWFNRRTNARTLPPPLKRMKSFGGRMYIFIWAVEHHQTQINPAGSVSLRSCAPDSGPIPRGRSSATGSTIRRSARGPKTHSQRDGLRCDVGGCSGRCPKGP